MATTLAEKQKFCTINTHGIVSYCKIPNASGTRSKWPKLNELYLHLFETDFSGSHDAGADGEACARYYFELKKRGIIK